MFRLHKNRPAKSGERIDFKLSQFKALQVPKGWDKLFVSIISVETGKTIAKSGKAIVRNGTCQWTETLAESVWLSHDDPPREMDNCLFRLVISMGSARSGILGEATINMTSYLDSSASVPVSLPLKKCNYGTVLQVKIHCHTPKAKLRDDVSKETNTEAEDLKSKDGNRDIKSDKSESALTRNGATSSNKELGVTSRLEDLESTETSFSSSASHHSSDSAENSSQGEKFSPENDSSADEHNHVITENSIRSLSVDPGNCPVSNSSRSNISSYNSQIMDSGNHVHNNQQVSSLRNTNSSKNFLEAAEDTIEELRAEAKMWERNARKLMLELDMLRQEFSDVSKNHADLNIEFSAATMECDSLRNEVEQLKLLLANSRVDDSKCQNEGLNQIQMGLEEEIKFLKENNADLVLQLNKSQESNIELVSVLQELEQTVEKQKLELEKLMILQSKFSGMEDSLFSSIKENKNLKVQLRQMQEAEKDLKMELEQLEKTLEEKKHVVEDRVGLEKRLVEIKKEYANNLADKEEEIAGLKAKLSESAKNEHLRESADGGDQRLNKEIESLKDKVQELEMDCNELTEENLELLFKIKELNNRVHVVKDPQDGQVDNLTNEMLIETEKTDDLSVQEFEHLKVKVKSRGELGEPLVEDMTENGKVEAMLQLKEDEIKDPREYQAKLEVQVSDLEKEKIQLEEKLQIIQRESEITSKCLADLQNDLMVLSNSVGCHVSANKILEKKSLELEQESVRLSIHVSELEDHLNYLTEEKELRESELKEAREFSESLRGEISKLTVTNESQKIGFEEKLREMHDWVSKAQGECDHLRNGNAKLQATIERLLNECSSLQKSNGVLQKQNIELHMALTSHLNGCSTKVKMLEENLSSLLEEVASKERTFCSELNALLDDNQKQKEKLTAGESLLNQMYIDKTVEIEHLRQEMDSLTKQISEVHDEKEKVVSNATDEISKLRTHKAELELALRETQYELEWKDHEFNKMQVEYMTKLNDLTEELKTTQEEQKMLANTEEKWSRLLKDHRLREEKLRTAVNELELKLTVCEYDRRQLAEDSTNAKVRLQKFENLQDQLVDLTNEISATKYEKEKLEASLKSLSEECRDLKAEKNAFVEKISTLQNLVKDLEDCRQSKIALEQKIQHTEGDLMTKEALCEEVDELKNELSYFRRENKQYQRMVQQLEEKKEEYLRRARAFEEELTVIKEEKRNLKHSGSMRNPGASKAHIKPNPTNEETNLSKRDIRRKAVLKSVRRPIVKDQQNSNVAQHQTEQRDNHIQTREDESFHDVGVDPRSSISLLENEFVDSVEAGGSADVSVSKLSGGHRPLDVPRKTIAEGEVVAKAKYERTKSSLEAELRDIRERYLSMSLKYAEVEAEREQLVMKLKASQSARRWFS